MTTDFIGLSAKCQISKSSGIYTTIPNCWRDKMKGLKKGTAHEVYTPKSEVDICLNCPLSECGKKDCKRFGKEKKKLKGRKRV